MSSRLVAGVDWAGGQWLAVIFEDRSYEGCILEEDFAALLEDDDYHSFDLVVVDVPIGLPDDEETLERREKLDSLARSVTGRPSSVFPVPSRGAAKKAYEGSDYEDVADQNEEDIEKGLSQQSYQIAAGIGEVDEFLIKNKDLRETVVEAHPEVCFRGLLGTKLQYSKNTAAGVGERLEALGGLVDTPSTLLEEITIDLIDESAHVDVDDVIDAIALGIVASQTRNEIRCLPKDWKRDTEELPMRMVYWAEESLETNTDD